MWTINKKYSYWSMAFALVYITYISIIVPLQATDQSDEFRDNTIDVSSEQIYKEILIDDGKLLVLPSKETPFSKDYRPKELIKILANTNGPIPCLKDIYIEEDIIKPLSELIEVINSKDGCELVVSSAYRSYQTQEELFNDKILRIMAAHPELKNNMLKAEEIAELEVSRPGTSQHITGRAIDFTTRSLYKEYLLKASSGDPILREKFHFLREEFLNTKEGRLLEAYAHGFGFILPFQKGKEHITGFRFEPWHYLYVGKYHAKTIAMDKLTIPLYYNFIRNEEVLYRGKDILYE